MMAPVHQRISTFQVRSNPPPRVEAGRRVRAARFMAGGISLRETATATGMSYPHLAAVERGEHPLTSTDAVALGELLHVPPAWLRDGWT
jgi:hypothetical protein